MAGFKAGRAKSRIPDIPVSGAAQMAQSLSEALSSAADRDQMRLEWFDCIQSLDHLESLRPEAVLSKFFAAALEKTSEGEPKFVPNHWPELLQPDSSVRDAIRRVITENIEMTLPGFDAVTSAGTRPLPLPRSYHLLLIAACLAGCRQVNAASGGFTCAPFFFVF